MFLLLNFAVAENEENPAVSSSLQCSQVSSSEGRLSTIIQPPVKKKPRLIGGVDINSPDIQKLIHAKSAHMSLVDEVLYCPFIAFLSKNSSALTVKIISTALAVRWLPLNM